MLNNFPEFTAAYHLPTHLKGIEIQHKHHSEVVGGRREALPSVNLLRVLKANGFPKILPPRTKSARVVNQGCADRFCGFRNGSVYLWRCSAGTEFAALFSKFKPECIWILLVWNVLARLNSSSWFLKSQIRAFFLVLMGHELLFLN